MDIKNAGLLAFLVLVGCDQKPPVGVSPSSMEASGSSDSAEVTRSKVLEFARTQGMVQRTPLLPLILQGINSIEIPAKYVNVGEEHSCVAANDRNKYAAEIIMLRADPAMRAIADEASAFSRDPEVYEAICAKRRIGFVMQPRTGWESTNTKAMGDFAKLIYLLGDSAADVLAPIALELSHMNGATEAEIIAAARERFVSKAAEYNRSFWERDKQAKLRLTLDSTGRHNSPVHFTEATQNADVAIDGYGLLLVKNGVEWLGRGYIKGTNYSIETVSQQAVMMSKGSSFGEGQNTQLRQSSDATGGIK